MESVFERRNAIGRPHVRLEVEQRGKARGDQAEPRGQALAGIGAVAIAAVETQIGDRCEHQDECDDDEPDHSGYLPLL